MTAKTKKAATTGSPATAAAKAVKRTDISLADRPLNWRDWNKMSDSEFHKHCEVPVKYDEGHSAWLLLPDIFIHDIPIEWEISLKYKDETVSIKGPSDSVKCGNMDIKNYTAFSLLAESLSMSCDGETILQPKETEGCTKRPIPEITIGAAGNREITFDIKEKDGKRYAYNFDFLKYYNVIQPYLIPLEDEQEEPVKKEKVA
jgi:hypothetical protein